MFCPQCGNQCNDQSRFCEKCGFALPLQYDSSIPVSPAQIEKENTKVADTPNPDDEENEHPLIQASYIIAFVVSIPMTKSWYYRMMIARMVQGSFLYYFNIFLLFSLCASIVWFICSIPILIYGKYSSDRQLQKSATKNIIESLISVPESYISLKCNVLFIPISIIHIIIAIIIRCTKKSSAKQ